MCCLQGMKFRLDRHDSGKTEQTNACYEGILLGSPIVTKVGDRGSPCHTALSVWVGCRVVGGALCRHLCPNASLAPAHPAPLHTLHTSPLPNDLHQLKQQQGSLPDTPKSLNARCTAFAPESISTQRRKCSVTRPICKAIVLSCSASFGLFPTDGPLHRTYLANLCLPRNVCP